jgi:uncharacterized membrane protein
MNDRVTMPATDFFAEAKGARSEAANARSSLTAQRALLLLAVMTFVAAFLRLVTLTDQSLWLDEVSSVRNAAAFGGGGLRALAGVDHIAPLHSICLWISTSIWGATAFAVRFPSAIAGILLIPAIYAVVVQMFGSRSLALITAALVTISPFAIWYSQEGRMYAMLLLATVTYVAVAWPIVDRPLRIAELAVLGLVTLAGLGAHHYMALVSVAFGLFLLIEGRGINRRNVAWGVSQLIAAAIFAYWIVLTLQRIEGGQAGFEKPGSVLLWAPYTYYTFLMGFTYGPSVSDLALAGDRIVDMALSHGLAIAVVALAAATLLWLGIRAALRTGRHPALLWLAMWLIVPLLLALVMTFVANIFFNVRYVIASFPALMIFVALAIQSVPWHRLPSLLQSDAPRAERWPALAGAAAAVALIGCTVIATVAIYTDDRYARADVRALAGFLRTKPDSALLITDNNRLGKVLDYYDGPSVPRPLQVDYRYDSMSPQVVWRNIHMRDVPADTEYWLIEYRSWEGDPKHYLRRQFDRNARLLDEHRWPGVSVRRYRLSPASAAASVNKTNDDG